MKLSRRQRRWVREYDSGIGLDRMSRSARKFLRPFVDEATRFDAAFEECLNEAFPHYAAFEAWGSLNPMVGLIRPHTRLAGIFVKIGGRKC